METEQAEDGDNYPMFDSGYPTVLTNSMLNCRKVEEHAISIMQAEPGVQMMSPHKQKKTYYAEARDGNIYSFEVDASIAPVKQDLIGGRAVANALKFQVILDEDPNICGIHQRTGNAIADGLAQIASTQKYKSFPCIDGKLRGAEHPIIPIPLISDDLRLFGTMAQRLAKAGEVSYQPLNEMRQKKRKSQGGNRDGQDRREDRLAASIKHSTSCTYNQDGRPVMITKHIGASMGYDQNDRHQHIASCATVMDSQPTSITKTGEAGHWHDLETIR